MSSPGWSFWIDRGGTFTDCIGRDPHGRLHVAKVPSRGAAPLTAIRQLLSLPPGGAIPPCQIRLGTTVATNALLERRGVPTGLLITEGFEDALEIGTQARPDIFALDIQRPKPLYTTRLGTAARGRSSGRIAAAPAAGLEARLREMKRSGAQSLAVVVLHGYLTQALERDLEAIAERAGFEHVSLSHEVNAEIGLLDRGDTACVDAYLTPLIRRYVAQLEAALEGSELLLMQSSGGLTPSRGFRGHNAILSGPAGGVVAAARLATAAGYDKIIGFDMGGTSTDVSRFDGRFERTYTSEIAGVRLRSPMLAVHTVAAGGGSICRFDGQRLTVGPDSVGAEPGPLCYGAADAAELSLTDVNLALGRVVGDHFPIPIDGSAGARALEDLAARAGLSATATATGLFDIANEHMASAIRRISVARGHDVRAFTLVVFGGAGGQHACAVARRLAIRQIFFPRFAGVLSAFGMGLADRSWHGEAGLPGLSGPSEQPRVDLSDAALANARATCTRLEAKGRAELSTAPTRSTTMEGEARSGASTEIQLIATHRVDLRYAGTETTLTFELESRDSSAGLEARFFEAHQKTFGYARPEHPIELVTARVEVTSPGHKEPSAPPQPRPAGRPIREATLHFSETDRRRAPVFEAAALAPGQRLAGPAIVVGPTSTIIVEPGFVLSAIGDGSMSLEVDKAHQVRVEAGDTAVDPVRLELFNHRFMAIAEEMGEVLRRTALSTNIRERLDFSCAVFDARGELVANAPHIPVHLGAMGASVRGVVDMHHEIAPGDVFATNDPNRGGSHLPDITVVTPVFNKDGGLVFFAANRGHHADVGGITPGSMPPSSTHLSQEGVLLSAVRIVKDGVLDTADLLARFQAGPHPARNTAQNLADLDAQIAANRTGSTRLLELAEEHSLDVVAAYMGHVRDNAARSVRAAIAKLEDGVRRFEDAMDDGTPIVVTITVSGDSMSIDFEDTGPEVDSNTNAPTAVTHAAVLYVLRALVGEPIPLNAGCLDPVEIKIPRGSILNPGPERAVCGGNVETSQRVVDVLLGALNAAAASQGTMNNLTFGHKDMGYYETICGGAGAGAEFDGAHAVQTHMTNTRITDPEILESRYPIEVRQFAIRVGSGGRGKHAGGDGVIREIELTAPLDVSILSERRRRQPFGLEGGQPGAAGRNLVNGHEVGGRFEGRLDAGDRVVIETPGGGGFGPPSDP